MRLTALPSIGAQPLLQATQKHSRRNQHVSYEQAVLPALTIITLSILMASSQL